jgi:hypothetical protein
LINGKILIEIMAMLKKRDDSTDQDIREIELKIAYWSSKWLKLTGSEGVSNYTHPITSGHIVFYMKEWMNIYRFSM